VICLSHSVGIFFFSHFGIFCFGHPPPPPHLLPNKEEEKTQQQLLVWFAGAATFNFCATSLAQRLCLFALSPSLRAFYCSAENKAKASRLLINFARIPLSHSSIFLFYKINGAVNCEHH